MKFAVVSQKELDNVNGYLGIRENHLLITIKSPKEKLTIPKSRYCKESLQVEFADTEEISEDSFNLDIASKIIDFVNNHCNEADMIVVYSKRGLSRSVSVASALSKILNHKDDDIFSRGIPNMLTYTLLLDYYFSELIETKWNSIHYLRDLTMSRCLDAFQYRQWKQKEQ